MRTPAPALTLVFVFMVAPSCRGIYQKDANCITSHDSFGLTAVAINLYSGAGLHIGSDFHVATPSLRASVVAGRSESTVRVGAHAYACFHFSLDLHIADSSLRGQPSCSEDGTRVTRTGSIHCQLATIVPTIARSGSSEMSSALNRRRDDRDSALCAFWICPARGMRNLD